MHMLYGLKEQYFLVAISSQNTEGRISFGLDVELIAAQLYSLYIPTIQATCYTESVAP